MLKVNDMYSFIEINQVIVRATNEEMLLKACTIAIEVQDGVDWVNDPKNR
jgi:hypothetical protein